MVGYEVTLADIALANFSVMFFRFYLNKAKRNKYESLTRHFDYMAHQPAFKKIVGRVWLCEERLKPLGHK